MSGKEKEEDDWGVMPLGNPGELTDDPRFKGTVLSTNEAGKAVIASEKASPEGEGSKTSGARRKNEFTGTTVNMADAERARANAMWARKEAELAQHHEDRAGLAGTKMGATKDLPKLAPKPMTYDELLAKANEMLAAKKAETESALAAGPALSARDDAGGILPDWLVKQRY